MSGIDASTVVARLSEAGATLMALPHTGPSTRMRSGGLEWVRDVPAIGARAQTKVRPAVPDAAAIDRMDQALAWLSLIPQDRYVLRRVVGARSVVCPLTGRQMLSWRRIGAAIGADHKAVQRWHAQGVALIVDALNRQTEAGANAGRKGGGGPVPMQGAQTGLKPGISGRVTQGRAM